MLVDLDDPAARDAAVVGAKAAGLARARAAGLPALPGVIVPAQTAREVVRVARGALQQAGSGRARMTVMQRPMSDSLQAALRQAVEQLGEKVVVRSSSTVEDDGSWAGAFSSFSDVGSADIETAVRGVWASVFSPDVLRRCDVSQTALPDIGVLVQPQIATVGGGTCVVDSIGDAVVAASSHGPQAIVGGREAGVTARVTPTGNVDGSEAVGEFGAVVLSDVAALARQTEQTLGHRRIEWAVDADGTLVLLQSSPTGPVRRVEAEPLAPPRAVDLHLARLATTFGGGLGDDLVLAWAGAAPPVRRPVAASVDMLVDLAAAEALAQDLAAAAWETDADHALVQARSALAAARYKARDRTGVPPAEVDFARGQHVVDLIESIGAAARDRGLLPDASAIWNLTLDEARGLGRGRRPVSSAITSGRRGPSRWEPFVASAVLACGTLRTGQSVVSGVAAGAPVVVSNPHQPPRSTERAVLFASRPLPALSSLLWGASALVVEAGSVGAHLFEVADALGVPTVLGVGWADLSGGSSDPDGTSAGECLCAVDGGAGVVGISGVVEQVGR